MDEKVRLTITKHLGDLRALENHGANAIGRQIDDMRGKNYPEAQRSFEDFKQTLDSHVKALDSRLHVIQAGYLALDQLPGFLGGAEVVCYPSLFEGFGLLVLEAMACGAAVLTTRRGPLPEVGGG